MWGKTRFIRMWAWIGLSSVVFHNCPVSASPGPSSFLIRCWQTTDGLPHNSPTGVCQAPDGDLWIAMNWGISRFDGVRFENFITRDGIPDSQVQALFFDSKKRLWIGTRRGVAFRENGKWQTLGQEWSTGSCWSIAETSDGSMWFGSEKDLWRWKDGKAEHRELRIKSLRAATDGSLWIIDESSVTQWINGQIQAVPELDRVVAGREISGMVPAGDGSWLLFGQNLLVKGAGDRWVSLTEGMPDAEGRHTSCAAGADGSVWVATRNSGIAYLKDGVWTRIDTNDGLSHDDVRFLMEDDEGNIWACTNGGGLNQVRHRRIEVFGRKEGLGKHVTTALVTDAAGQLWAGTDGGGLKRLEGDTFVPAMSGNSLVDPFIWSLGDDGSGGLWIGTFNEGLMHWKNGQSRAINAGEGLLNNWIHGLHRDRAGDLWIGTHNGAIQRLHNGVLLTEHTFRDEPPIPVTGFLEKRDGELWAYTAGNGIFRRTGQQWQALDGAQALPSKSINTLHEDGQGRVWVGTAGRGLALWNGKSYTVWDHRQGLASNVVLQILDDSRGNLWLGTNVGLQRVSIEDLLAVGEGKRESLLHANLYSRDEGLTLPQFSSGHGNLATKTPDGALWFSMAAGAVRVPPGTDDTPNVPLPLRIESVTLDGRTLWQYESHTGNALELPSPDGALEFRFAAPSFNNPEKLRFRYRLVGLDDSWRDTEGRRVVTFSSLPPGDFRFEVSAARPGSAWQDKTAVIGVRINPKFWQTWWFLGGCIVSGSMAIAMSVRWWSLRRIRRRMVILEQERKLEGERSRIAQDLHDDLGATLTEINFLGVLGAAHANSPATRDRLEGIVERAQRMAKSLDEIVWTVNPANDSLSSTVNYLCSRAQESLSSANLRCRLEVAEGLPSTVLDSERRHHLLMAVNEAVNNVMKHASATEVRISLHYQQDSLLVTITDDGCGFDPDAVAAGRNGLGNMRKRMESDGGSCVIRSQPGHATQVILTLPVSNRPNESRRISTRSGGSR